MGLKLLIGLASHMKWKMEVPLYGRGEASLFRSNNTYCHKKYFYNSIRYHLTLLYRLSRQCSKYILNIIKLFTQKAYTPKAKFIEDSYSLS